MQSTSENMLKAFNQLPEMEKHAVASEIIRQVALLGFPSLIDGALMEIADTFFLECDKWR